MRVETHTYSPATTLHDLCKKIDQATLPQSDNVMGNSLDEDSENFMDDDLDLENEFVPETILRKLINPDAVENVLRHSRDHHGLKLQVPIPELAQWFSKDAFKLFAILAKNGHLNLIEHLYHKRIQDDILPITPKKTMKLEADCKLKPYDKRFDDSEQNVSKALHYSQHDLWDVEPKKIIRHFHLTWQWQFTSPVFVKDQFRYRFHSKVRLPFTRTGAKNMSPNSLYSYVQEKSVHVDHLPKDLVRSLGTFTSA